MFKNRQIQIAFLIVGVVLITGLLSGVRAQENEETLGATEQLLREAEGNLSGAEQIAWIEKMTAVSKEAYRAIQGMLNKARAGILKRRTTKTTVIAFQVAVAGSLPIPI